MHSMPTPNTEHELKIAWLQLATQMIGLITVVMTLAH